MKCDACGLESDYSAAFFKERKAFGKVVQSFCPNCWARRGRMIAAWPLIGIILIGIIGCVLYWLKVCPELAQALNSIFLCFVFFILSVVPHELGHAIAGWLLGFRVFAVAFGYGKQIFKFHLFGTVVSVCSIPAGGLTRSAPKSVHWYRARTFFRVLAGPAANAIIVVTIALISPYHAGVPTWAQMFLIANLLVLIGTLVPYRDPFSKRDSDGKNLIKAFFMKPEEIQQTHVSRFVLEAGLREDEYQDFEGAAEWCEKGLALYPDDLQLLNLSATIWVERRNYTIARQIFVQLLRRESTPPEWYFSLLNNIAYTDVLIGDPTLLSEADSFSEETYRSHPCVNFVIGTRGIVLVEMGEYEEGIKLLKVAIEKHENLRSKALNACYLAIACARMGKYDQSDKYLKLARQFDLHCSLLERAEAELLNRN